MSLLAHAQREIIRARRKGDVALEENADIAVLDLIAAFAGQGHSGGSAGFVGPRLAYIIGQLLAFGPITPLTGEESEWETPEWPSGDRPLQQNVRCSRVFRELHGDDWIAYDSTAIVWQERRSGGGFTGRDSARRVTFPYTPKTRHVPAWRRRIVTTLARLRGQLRP